MPTRTPLVPQTVVKSQQSLPKEPLKGEKLLQYLKQLQGLPMRDKALYCGYYVVTKSHAIRVNVEAFTRAVLVAMNLDSPEEHRRKLGHKITVQRNGSVVISGSYLRKVGYYPGQQLYIKLGENAISLVSAEYANGKAS